MANGVWINSNLLLGPSATSILQECVSKQIFNIYASVGYPSPAQGTITFPELSGYVPDSMQGIQRTQAEIQQIGALLASVDSRLRLWAWFGTYSTDDGGGDDATGHINARMDIDTTQRRAAVINACMTVARWGFYGVQDDTEDLRPASLESNGQFGATYVTFTNEFANAAKAEGLKYQPFVPCVWTAFVNNFVSQITAPDEIILAGSLDDNALFPALVGAFFQNVQRPVIYNFGWTDTAPWSASRLDALPFSSVSDQIAGYAWYDWGYWGGNWSLWDSWRASHPDTSGGGTVTPGGTWNWDGKKIPDAMLTRAINAANAAANGSKNNAFLQSLKTDLGTNPKRYLVRDTLEVWEGAVSGQVVVQNNQLVIPASSATVRVDDADIDTGTWLHRLVNATNSANQIVSRVSKTGGAGPLFLSDDLLASSGTLNVQEISYAGLAFDTAPAPVSTEYILSIGDSITNGSYPTDPIPYVTWRGAFQSLLIAAGRSYDMIGPQTEGLGGGPDVESGSWGGAAIDGSYGNSNNIDDRLGQIFTADIQPTTIVFYIGRNDLWQAGSQEAATAPARWLTLLNKMRELRPSAKFIVCTMLLQWDNARPSHVVTFNNAVRDFANANTSFVRCADLDQIVLVPGDLADGTHLAAGGAAKVAQSIYNALLSFDSSTTTITLNTPSVTASTATLSMIVAGTPPAGSQMQIQITTNASLGPWVESVKPTAVAGLFTHTFTGLLPNTTYYWRAFVFTDPGGVVHAQTGNSTFLTSSVPASTEWVQMLYDSMAVQNVTERVSSGDDYGKTILADGTPGPFPDSYAGVVSFAGMQAMLSGRPTGEADTNIQFFTQGVNTQGVWQWFAAKQGHTATQSRLRVSGSFLGILRESSRQWELMYKGARASGVRYYGNGGQEWGVGEDLGSDPNATYIAPAGRYNYELWPYPTVSNTDGITNFFGKVNRDLITDMRSWVLGVRVRVEGADKENARFIGTIGIDHYRTDHEGRRYWTSGYPKYVSDSGGAEWQNIRNDGEDQWIVAIGCWEIGRMSGNRPPWGNYDGTWPYAASPDYGPSWAEIAANPPPDYRNY